MAVDEELLRKVQDLGDLDLAALLCLISREHCIVSTEAPSLDDLVAELQLVASRSFNLTSVVVDCTPQTTLDDLASSIQLPSPGATNAATPRSTSPLRSRNDTYFPYQQQQQQQQQRPGRSNSIASSTTHHHHLQGPHAHGHGTSSRALPVPLRALTPIAAATTTTTAASPNINNNNHSSATPTPQIANVILAKNLDRAPKAVQIQCLELLRTRRLFTRTSVQTAPKQFLFVAVLGADSIGGGGSGRLTKHLNDFFYIAHWHDPEDGFAHLEEQEEDEQEAAEAAAAAMSGGGVVGGDGEEDYENEIGGAYDDDASMQSDESVVRRPQSRSTTTAARTSTPTSTMKTDAWGSGGGGGYRDSASARSLWKEKSTINSTTSNTYYSATHNNNSNSNNNPLLLSPKAELTNPPPLPPSSPVPPPLFRAESDIPALALAASSVAVDIEVLRYQMNVISFLRMHRAVAYAGGVGPLATRHMSQLVRCLAALHGLDYATPSLVGLAARKVYPHRLRLVVDFEGGGGAGKEEEGGRGGMSSLEHERSVQWGSDLAAVEALLEGVGPQDVIDDVLGMVAAPL
ncbi:hypothetical protein F4775DRAFT_62902 [Biscogniauxia sp. FL1348]|nr:hypothetical protein F4775DRAFT_62902 [Biscogniauxia sp. FL1348]